MNVVRPSTLWFFEKGGTKDPVCVLFFSVLTYIYCCSFVDSLIMAILLATKVLKLSFSMSIYLKTFVLSVQNTKSSNSISSSSFNILSVFTATTAAVNFMRGIVVCFSGATWDFPIMKSQCASPSAFTNLKYETTHIPSYLCLRSDEYVLLL